MNELIVGISQHLVAATSFLAVGEALDAVEKGDEAEIQALRVAFMRWPPFSLNADVEHPFPDVGALEDGVVRLWREALECSELPLLRARLGDLLWLRRSQPRPDLAARIAIDCYLILGESWDGLDSLTCVARAVALARAVNDQPRCQPAYALARSRFDEALSDTRRPGVSLNLLRMLAVAPAPHRPNDMDAVLQRAEEALGQDPHYFETITELRLHLAGDDQARRAALQEGLAQRWAEYARSSEGISQIVHLQRALVLAQNMPALRTRLLQQQAQIDPATLGFRGYEIAHPLDEGRVKRVLDQFLGAPSFSVALDRLLMQLKPVGDAENNVNAAQRYVDQSILGRIASNYVWDPEVPQARPVETEDQRMDRELGELESRMLAFNTSLFFKPVLGDLPIRYEVDTDSLVSYLSETGGPIDAVRLVVRAAEAWWSGDTAITSAMMLIPAIEALTRHLAVLADIAVTDVATGDVRGGVRPLGDLLSALQGHLGESHRRFLRCALVSDSGWNLRNRLCHGLKLSPDQDDVAVLLLAAMLLCRLQVSGAVDPHPGRRRRPTPSGF